MLYHCHLHHRTLYTSSDIFFLIIFLLFLSSIQKLISENRLDDGFHRTSFWLEALVFIAVNYTSKNGKAPIFFKFVQLCHFFQFLSLLHALPRTHEPTYTKLCNTTQLHYKTIQGNLRKCTEVLRPRPSTRLDWIS